MTKLRKKSDLTPVSEEDKRASDTIILEDILVLSYTAKQSATVTFLGTCLTDSKICLHKTCR